MRTTFRPDQRFAIPEKINFLSFVNNLKSDKEKIQEALDLEARSARPFKLQGVRWFDRGEEPEWVLACLSSITQMREFSFVRCRGNWFDQFAALPPHIRKVQVWRMDGLFMRSYERVFSFFKRSSFDILADLSHSHVLQMHSEIGPIRQRANTDDRSP